MLATTETPENLEAAALEWGCEVPKAVLEFRRALPHLQFQVGYDNKGRGIAHVWEPRIDAFNRPYEAATPSEALRKAIEPEQIREIQQAGYLASRRARLRQRSAAA